MMIINLDFITKMNCKHFLILFNVIIYFNCCLSVVFIRIPKGSRLFHYLKQELLKGVLSIIHTM